MKARPLPPAMAIRREGAVLRLGVHTGDWPTDNLYAGLGVSRRLRGAKTTVLIEQLAQLRRTPSREPRDMVVVVFCFGQTGLNTDAAPANATFLAF